jgi:tetratricopeptide (TPR) repeat protein
MGLINPILLPVTVWDERRRNPKLPARLARHTLKAIRASLLQSRRVPLLCHICRRVDGIPLAIELAAAHVDMLQVSEILKQLSRRFDLLANNSRTALPRHQTMRASMDWSWGLLTPSERTFTRQLSAFAGGWTLESAKAVCDGDILNLTSALVKKSLIAVKQELGHETRYQFHEIVRQYAREKLEEAGENVAMRDKHRDVFLAYVENSKPEILRADQKKWIDALEAEHDNIRTALSWSIETQSAEQALRFCSALSIFWERHKHYLEAALACKDALACVKQNESLKTTAWYASVLASTAFYIAATELIPWSDPSIRTLFEQARKIYDVINDYNSTGPVLTSQILTYVYMNLNDLSSAEKCVSHWYEKVNTSGYQWGIALAKRSMAEVSIAKGQPDYALALWQESYEMFMEIGDVWAAKEVSRSLIWQKVMRGEFEEGIGLLKENLLFYEEYGDPGGVASSYIYLGIIAREKGQYESAKRYFIDANALGAEIGDKGWSIDGAERVAYLDYLEGNVGTARAKYEAVLRHLKDIPPDDSTYGIFHTRFAQISLSENHLAEARKALAVGLEVTQKIDQKVDIYAAYYGLGELARLEGNYSESIENYRAGLRAVHDDSLYIELPRILDGIAKTEYLRSKFDKAARLFGASQALRKKMTTVIHIVDLPDYDKHVELLKSRIRMAEFESAWEQGTKMSPEEVYKYAIQDGK